MQGAQQQILRSLLLLLLLLIGGVLHSLYIMITRGELTFCSTPSVMNLMRVSSVTLLSYRTYMPARAPNTIIVSG